MKSLVVVLILLAMPASISLAQKGDPGPIGIFDSRTEYNQFMGNIKTSAYGEGGSAELQAMVPMINDIVLNQPIGQTAGQYNAQGTTLGMLADGSVRGEIEMVDDQYKELQEVGRQIQQKSADQLRGLDFSDRSKLIQQVRAMQTNAQKELNAVLLPHQIERLRQIRFQSLLRRNGLVGILTSDPVKTNLKITDEQTDELRKAEKEIAAEMEREILKLREKAKDKLLSRLKPTQKKEVEEMIGDTFDFSESDQANQSGKGKKNSSSGAKRKK